MDTPTTLIIIGQAIAIVALLVRILAARSDAASLAIVTTANIATRWRA